MRALAFLLCAALFLIGATAQAAFIVEPDIDGLDDAIITYSPNFSFGNAGTVASQSIAGTAVGLTGGDSIFGGDGAPVDQYVYSYTPGSDLDNAFFIPGAALGNGNNASGLTGGGSGFYNVYACWPNTANISDDGAVPTNYLATSDGPSVQTGINQDEDTNGALVGGPWVLIGTVQLTAGNTYTITQTAPNSLFVSMRSAGVMWELAIPEPGSAVALLALGGIALVRRMA